MKIIGVNLGSNQNIYKVLILVGLIGLLTACSSTRLVYTFVDKFIEDEVAYFLDLDTEEELVLSQQISEMVAWHKTSMLPKYATYLTDIADMIEMEQYEASDISKILENGSSLIKETVNGLTPYASKFLIQHQTVEAIEFMEKRMLTRQQERIIELSKPEDLLHENRLRRLKSNFKRFLGDLNNAQVILLEAYSQSTLGESRIRLHNRTVRQKVFIRFLRTKPAEAELTAYLNKLLLRGHLITNPTYQIFSEVSLDRFHGLLVNILETSSREQQDTIISNLRDYAEDFKDVSLGRNISNKLKNEASRP